MKKHKDLLEILKANKMRITSARRLVLDCKVHHFYICKACSKASRVNEKLYKQIEAVLI